MEQYITDDQDPKTVEKVIGKLRDMLTSGETIIYLAIQKKPAVTLIPDCIAVTNKRLIFCLPGNLGLTTSFSTYLWEDIKEVSFKEEFFGSKFITVPQTGENLSIDYIPKVQARKLYQFCNQQLEDNRELKRKRNSEAENIYTLNSGNPVRNDVAEDAENTIYTEFEEAYKPEVGSVAQTNSIVEPEDEVTSKLKKLKILFEKQLISQQEYEAKKADILSQL